MASAISPRVSFDERDGHSEHTDGLDGVVIRSGGGASFGVVVFVNGR